MTTPRRLGTEHGFAEARLSFLERMPREARIRAGYADDYYPYTYPIGSEELMAHDAILTAIHEGVDALVRAYERDARIREVVPLREKTRERLARIEAIPVREAYLRPDFIYDEQRTPLICEIGARFAFNGFYMSAYVNQSLPYEERLPGLHQLHDALAQLTSTNAVIVKDHEPGYDIHCFHYHTNAAFTKPRELPRDGLAVLELHEYELEEHLETICERMLGGLAVVNDPRIVLIAHDKRLLALLGNEPFMREYVSTQSAATLAQHIIPTSCSGIDVPREAHTDPDAFVAKVAKSGKTQGFRIGTDTDEWKRVLSEQGHAVQPRITQPRVFLWDTLREEWKPWHLAGTLYRGAENYGPGLLRAFNTTVTKMSYLVQPSKKQ